ncbi:DUF6645 domain-containing protein [Escherichia coli]
MSSSKWVLLASMPGNFTVKVSGGTVAFCESPLLPSGNEGGMTFANCLINFNTKDLLWVRVVSGTPNVEISGAGISGIIPLTDDIVGSGVQSDWEAAATEQATQQGTTTEKEPEWYYVVVLAGQSNGMAYGEGLPLPETYDRPDMRIKQLARRSTVTPGGAACAYNDIIPADHCLHDVQDMSGKNHPKADTARGQYGTVGQGLHIAKKLLPFIPAEAGILLVPCCRGGSAFTAGVDGEFQEASGATENSTCWGADKPLYKDVLNRTKAALEKNVRNRLLAVVWMQGEYDIDSKPAEHSSLFLKMVNKYRTDLENFAEQCAGGSAAGVPWICGDTTYFWKEKNESAYKAVYGSYQNKTDQNIHFVPFMTDENGQNVSTNNPAEDPDIESIHYYGSTWRNSSSTWTSKDRASHFSAFARRGILSDRIATAILAFGERGSITPKVEPSSPPVEDATGTTTLLAYHASEQEGKLKEQGWSASGGKATIIDDSGATAGKAMRVEKIQGQKSVWKIIHDVLASSAAELLKKGGEISFRFKIPEGTQAVKDQFAMGLYWPVSALPSGVTLAGDSGSNMLAAFFVQSDGSNLNLMQHKASPNALLGTFGAFGHAWHKVALRFDGNNSTQITPVIDDKPQAKFNLLKCPASGFENDKLLITDITETKETYPVLFDTIVVEINKTTG